MDLPLLTPDAPSMYVRDINLELRQLRRAILLPGRTPKGYLVIVFVDTDEVSTLAPRGRYALKPGEDYLGTPEMTRKVTDEFLTDFTEILVTATGCVPNSLERWVTKDDYEASLPSGSDQL